MPTYCFRHADSGDALEVFMTFEQLQRCCGEDGLYRIDGQEYRRDYAAESGGFVDTPGAWPMYSDAAGVAPHQVAAAHAKSVRDGVPTEFTRDGRAIFRDREHRARYLASIGMHDRSGGYKESRYDRRAYEGGETEGE